MEVKLNKEAVSVAYAASQDTSRLVLQSVCIGEGEIIATDGFILAKRKVETEGKTMLLNAKNLLDFYRIFAEDGELAISTSEDGKKTIIEKPDASIFLTVQPGNYPSIPRLYKNLEEPKAYVALGVGLLKKLIQLSNDSTFIKFRVRSSKNAVEFIVGDTYGLIMPMDVEEESELWHKCQIVNKEV